MVPLVKYKGKLLDGIGYILRQRKFRRGTAAVLFIIMLTLLISVDLIPQKVYYEPGDVALEEINAQRTASFVNEASTEEKRLAAAASIPPQYDRDEKVGPAVLKDITAALGVVGDIQQMEVQTEAERVQNLRAALPDISDASAAVLAKADAKSLQLLGQEIEKLLDPFIQSGISAENINSVKEALKGRLGELKLSGAYIELGSTLINVYLKPNSFYNAERTKVLQETARDAVPPVLVAVKKDENILRPGDIVTPEHIGKLQALGLSSKGVPWRSLSGSALLAMLFTGLVLFYVYQQHRAIFTSPGHLYLLGIIVLVVLAVARGILAINVNQWPDLNNQFGYMVPMAAAGMLIGILLDCRLAVLVVAVMSYLLSIVAGYQLGFGVVGLVTGIAGVYSVSRLSQRGDLARAGVYVGGAAVLAILIIGMLGEKPGILILWTAIFLGIINGILSSILTNGALPYLENTFGITSSVRLLELSHPSNPLLKRLLTESPGTYHHSIIVGNLAEAATEAVGGESILVRVGAYYHDIGKIKRPYFFIENQMNSDNPHDKIAPSLSTLILTAHVKDGLELARENRLPQDVLSIIEQHHGSGLVSYFYHKAMEAGGDNINEDEFRYDGPKPQTREAAIVMLADSVEAAVRSLQNRTHGRVEGLVRKIIKDKLMDGQLDECDLTLKDLDIIANAFLKVLSGIFHSRIEYPDVAKEMERRNKSGGARKQSAGRIGR